MSEEDKKEALPTGGTGSRPEEEEEDFPVTAPPPTGGMKRKESRDSVDLTVDGTDGSEKAVRRSSSARSSITKPRLRRGSSSRGSTHHKRNSSVSDLIEKTRKQSAAIQRGTEVIRARGSTMRQRETHSRKASLTKIEVSIRDSVSYARESVAHQDDTPTVNDDGDPPKSKDETIRELCLKLEEMASHCDFLKQELTEKTDESEELKDLVTQLTQEYKDCQDMLAYHDSEKESFQNELDVSKQEYTRLQERMEMMMQENEEMKLQLMDQLNMTKDMATVHFAAQNAEEQNSALQKQLDQYSAMLTRLNQRLKESNQEIIRLEKDKVEMTKEHEQAHKDWIDKQFELEKEIQEIAEELVMAQEDNQELLDVIQQLDDDREQQEYERQMLIEQEKVEEVNKEMEQSDIRTTTESKAVMRRGESFLMVDPPPTHRSVDSKNDSFSVPPMNLDDMLRSRSETMTASHAPSASVGSVGGGSSVSHEVHSGPSSREVESMVEKILFSQLKPVTDALDRLEHSTSADHMAGPMPGMGPFGAGGPSGSSGGALSSDMIAQMLSEMGSVLEDELNERLTDFQKQVEMTNSLLMSSVSDLQSLVVDPQTGRLKQSLSAAVGGSGDGSPSALGAASGSAAMGAASDGTSGVSTEEVMKAVNRSMDTAVRTMRDVLLDEMKRVMENVIQNQVSDGISAEPLIDELSEEENAQMIEAMTQSLNEMKEMLNEKMISLTEESLRKALSLDIPIMDDKGRETIETVSIVHEMDHFMMEYRTEVAQLQSQILREMDVRMRKDRKKIAKGLVMYRKMQDEAAAAASAAHRAAGSGQTVSEKRVHALMKRERTLEKKIDEMSEEMGTLEKMVRSASESKMQSVLRLENELGSVKMELKLMQSALRAEKEKSGRLERILDDSRLTSKASGVVTSVFATFSPFGTGQSVSI